MQLCDTLWPNAVPASYSDGHTVPPLGAGGGELPSGGRDLVGLLAGAGAAPGVQSWEGLKVGPPVMEMEYTMWEVRVCRCSSSDTTSRAKAWWQKGAPWEKVSEKPPAYASSAVVA